MTDIRSMTLEELKEAMTALGEKPFRAKQIYEWLHVRLVDDFDEMTNLSRALREKLRENYALWPLQALRVQTSKIDGTKKFLFALSDRQVVESVWMQYHHGDSVCISSQVGCRMGCKFCASGIGGLVRNLTVGEMLAQVYAIQKLTGERVSNVVVMGTGEPFDNYDTLIQFLRMLTDTNGLNISQRNITVSTCGIVPKIRAFAEEDLQVTLALSLHASDNEKRKELMPIAYTYSLGEVMDACRYYFQKTGRRMTYEYSLVGGVNDTREDAKALVGLLRGQNCHVNLIPVNPVKEKGYVQPDRTAVLDFKDKLEKYGINATIRREMGRDIDGACGQLRRSYEKSSETL
ncbi:23S rRNA (adenine(2503)-C(2))-methyltransferase RlmN [Oscillospiraceae bacterium NTUH-002-81]|nr:23S rRNA (adenine(2503)-C(2))-methyltransferase RlmN [Oscillospiraceae bacterium NTUH-002-81]